MHRTSPDRSARLHRRAPRTPVPGVLPALLLLAALGACADSTPVAGPPAALSEGARPPCVLEDDDAGRVRRASGGCTNAELAVPEGWSLSYAPTPRGPGALQAEGTLVAATATQILFPSAEYLSSTTRLPSASSGGVGGVSDGELSVTFSVGGSWAQVPTSWATWSSPPESESSTPQVIHFPTTSVTWQLSRPVNTFGFEIEPNPFSLETFTATFYAGPEVVAAVTRAVDGFAGARLMAVTSTDRGIDRVVIQGSADFAVAQLRYGSATEPELACTPASVERGEEVSCTLTGSGFTLRSWRFEGPRRLRVDAGPEAGRVWGGTVAEGGTVRATIEVDGQPRELTASFAVRARSWSWGEPQWQFVPDQPAVGTPVDRLPSPGTILGANCNRPNCVGRRVQPDIEVAPDGGYTVEPITSGPNRGLFFVREVTFHMDRMSLVNPQVRPGGPILNTVQPLPANQERECRQRMGLGPTDPVLVNFHTFNTVCKGLALDTFIPGILLHEGFGSNGSNGHESAGRRSAGEPRNDPYRRLEDYVGTDETQLRTRIRRDVGQMQDRIARDAANHNRVRGNWSGDLWLWDNGPFRRQRVSF